MCKLDLEKADEPEIKLPTSIGSSRKQESFRKTSTSALLTMPKLLTVWITKNCGKFLKRWEYQITWPASWEIYMQVRKQQLEPELEQWTGSKLGKEYVEAVHCHPAYLTSMQSASCAMPSWMKHKLELRLPGYTDGTAVMVESREELNRLLMKVKEESDKAGLKLNIQKAMIMASRPITSWQIDGKTVETVTDFIFLSSKIYADCDCNNEIKRCLLLGRKAMTNLDSILKSRDITLPTKVRLVKWVKWLSCVWLFLTSDRGSQPGSSDHGIFQARVLEWVAISFSKAVVFPVVVYGMWELDHKESWMPENWCFWTAVLEKTLWEALGLQGDQTSQSKGNQSWIFIGGTDAEAKAAILWPSDAKKWLIGKDPDAGKDWRQEGKGMIGWDGWMAWPSWWTWVWACQTLGFGGLVHCRPPGHKESGTTEQLNLTEKWQYQSQEYLLSNE